MNGIPARLIATASVVFLAACSNGDGNSPLQVALTSKATPKTLLTPHLFEGCTEYRRYFADAIAREVLEGWYGCWGCEDDIAFGAPAANDNFSTVGAPEDGAGAAEGDAAASPGFSDVTGTNTQEAGVDEADLVESDPRGYFYVARNNEVLVVRGSPADELSIAARFELETTGYGYTHGLYFDEPNLRLVVLTNSGPDYPGDGGTFPARHGSGALFLDVENPLQPTAVDWIWTEGWMVDSRRIADRMHMVSSHYFYMPPSLSQDDGFWETVSEYYEARYSGRTIDAERLATQIRVRVEAAVELAELSEILPLQKSGLGSGAAEPVDCASVVHSDVEHRMAMLVITSADTDGENPARLSTINNAWQLYGSQDYLYLIQGSAGWWFDVRQTQQTAIYRYRLTDNAVEPAGFGVVDGYALGSYSLGEHDGFLRVVTTESRFIEDGPWRLDNHLFVLGEGNDGNLETVGEVRNFLPDKNERIFSSRFLGDWGYVVTFEVIDPLFVFDLSDPENPRKTGEVEIPGFSTYIHPIDEGHLLTIGREVTPDGFQTNNILLQIFDVSDPTNPLSAHSHVPQFESDAWVFSVAGYDPHAFTYYGPEQLLSIPLQVGWYDFDGAFSGFIALDVDLANGFTELARIDHKLAREGSSGCPETATGDDSRADCASFAPDVYYNPPLRSVVGVEGEGDSARTVLFTLSHELLKSADVEMLDTELDSLELAP